MSTPHNRTWRRSPYWGVPIARALPAFVVTAITTFNPLHSAQLGLVVFGAYAIVSGILLSLLSRRFVADRLTRRLFLAQGIVSVLLGIVALVFNGGGSPYFLYLVSLFGALTGFLELYSGLRTRSRGENAGVDAAAAKDWIAVGAFTAVLALVFLAVPLDIVTAVGLFGGYTVVLGIFLVIGGLSLRWGPDATHTTPLSQETTS